MKLDYSYEIVSSKKPTKAEITAGRALGGWEIYKDSEIMKLVIKTAYGTFTMMCYNKREFTATKSKYLDELVKEQIDEKMGNNKTSEDDDD
jgi:hypothetical protein